MPTYLCNEGHKHKSQWAATNCHWCKKRERKDQIEYQKQRGVKHGSEEEGST